MSHERLAALIQAQREAMKTNLEGRITRETILSILILLDKGTITKGRMLRFLRYQAVCLVDEPIQATFYRRAAADLRQMRACRAVNKPNLDDAGTQGCVPSCGGLHFADSSQYNSEQSTSQVDIPSFHARQRGQG